MVHATGRRGLRSALFVSVVLGAALAGSSGCNSNQQAPPPGSSSGRIPVDEITYGEVRSDRISAVSLTEFADISASQLVEDMARLPEFRESEFAMYVVYGDIINKTGNVPTADLESVRASIRSRLMQSDFVRNQVRFIASRDRYESLRAQEFGRQEDLLQEGRGNGGRRLDPEYVLFLNGELYRIGRGRVNQYMLSFTLMRASDGVLLWESRPYESKEFAG